MCAKRKGSRSLKRKPRKSTMNRKKKLTVKGKRRRRRRTQKGGIIASAAIKRLPKLKTRMYARAMNSLPKLMPNILAGYKSFIKSGRP